MREREKAIVRSPDMADDPTPLPEDHHLLRDANDPDDWAWRRAIRQRPAALAAYRVVVLALGVVLFLGGLALVPLPVPDGSSCSSGWPSSVPSSSWRNGC